MGPWLLVPLSLPAQATTLQVSGTCPGTVTYRVTGTPSSPVVLAGGAGRGQDPVPAGACAGTPLELGAPTLSPERTTSRAGVATFRVAAGPEDCDLPVQAVDLATCQASPVRLQGPAPAYDLPGPWTVGSGGLPVTGRSGVSLPAEVWFPSDQVGQAQRVYVTRNYPDGIGGAFTDVAPACATPRPVLIHSHGSMSLPFEMYEVMEQLASHGWLVVAPEHTGNSWHSPVSQTLQMPYRRPEDVADAYDALLAEAARPGSPLEGCVDPAAGYAVSGSSYGGYTAYVAGGALVNDPVAATLDISDPAVRAVVTFVPWDALGLLSRGTRAVDVPVLTLGGERDSTVGTTYLDLWSHLTTEPRVLYSFPDGGHMTFTPLWCVQPGNGCGPGFVDQQVAVETAWTATLAFLEHLRGRDGALRQMPVRGPFSASQVGLP